MRETHPTGGFRRQAWPTSRSIGAQVPTGEQAHEHGDEPQHPHPHPHSHPHQRSPEAHRAPEADLAAATHGTTIAFEQDILAKNHVIEGDQATLNDA
jgi:hypothetical protein